MDRAREESALDKVTDYHEEKEIDSSKAQQALNAVSADDQLKKAEKLKREQELAAVKVDKENIDFLVRELEIAPARADRTLREHKNDKVAAIRALLAMKASDLANDNPDIIM